MVFIIDKPLMFIETPNEHKSSKTQDRTYSRFNSTKKVEKTELETKANKLVKFHKRDKDVLCLIKFVDKKIEGYVYEFNNGVLVINTDENEIVSCQINDVLDIEILKI